MYILGNSLEFKDVGDFETNYYSCKVAELCYIMFAFGKINYEPKSWVRNIIKLISVIG